MLHYHCYHHCTSLSQNSHSDVSCQYSHHTVHTNVTLPLLSSLYITVPTQSVLSVASTLATLCTLMLHYHFYHHCTSLSQNNHSDVSCQYSHHTVYTLMLHCHYYHHCTSLSQHSQCCQLPVLSPHCTHYCYIATVIITVHHCPNTVSDVSCQYSHHTVHIIVTLPLLSSLYISVPTQSQ